MPVVEHAVEVEAKPEIEPIRPEPTTSGSDDDAASTQVPHLADLDFGPGCDACAAVGDPGDRRVVATRAIRRGEVVVFEAPVAAVKAGEPVASDALASAFCDPRCGSPGGCKGSPTRTTSQVEIPSMGAIIGEHLHGCTDDVGGDRCATPGLFGLYGGGAGGKGKTRRRRTEVAGDRVPNEWLLTHQLLELRAQLCAPGTRPREWAGEYASRLPADAAERRRDEDIAHALAEEIGGDVRVEDVKAVHAVVCANAFALEAMCTRLNYGAGFFRAAAYLNHSCDPNCLSLRLGGNMAIFAARDVACGEELTHSYIPSHQLLLPSASRRPLLTFDCACARCARRSRGGSGSAATKASELENGESVWDTPLARAAIEIRTVAVTSGHDRPREVLDAFRSEVLEAPAARTALANAPPQAALSLLEPVLDAHWRAALNAGGSQGKVIDEVLDAENEVIVSAAPPASEAAVAARAWRDAASKLRRAAASEGVGVGAAADQTYAIAEVTAFMLDAAEGGAEGTDSGTAKRALMYLVAAHGDSLACAQEDTLCLRAMPAASAAAEAFERLVADAAVLRLREPGDAAFVLPPMPKAAKQKATAAKKTPKAAKEVKPKAEVKPKGEVKPKEETVSAGSDGSDGSKDESDGSKDGSDGSKDGSTKKGTKKARPKCPHGRQKYFCKDCGGTGICEHGRQRAWCRDCGVDTGELAAHYSEKRKGYKRDYRLRQKEKERRNSSRSPSPEDVCEPIGLPMQPTPTAVAPKPERAPAANIPIATPVFIMPNEVAVPAHQVGRIVSQTQLEQMEYHQVLEGVGAGWPVDRSPGAGDSGATSTAVHTHVDHQHPAGSSDTHEHDGAATLNAIDAWTAVTNSSDEMGGSRGEVTRKPARATAAGLTSLLGMAEKDAAIAAFMDALAKPSSPSSSPSSSEAEHEGGPRKSRKRSATQKPPPPEIKLFPPACKYVSHKALGVSLCYEKGVLDCVHVYADDVDGFSGYRHELPHGLRMTPCSETGAKPDCGRTVVERLGEPTQKGGTGRQIWMTYEHLGLKVDLAAVDWEDGDAPVRGASIWVA